MPMVLVRMLSQGEYGGYQQMILIGTAAVGVLTLGLPTSIYYFYHFIAPLKIPALVVQTTILLLLSGLLATGIVFFGADYFAASLNNPAISGLLKIYALSLLLTIGSEQCLHFMIAQNRYRLAVVFEVGETVVRVITLLMPLWLGFGLTGLIFGLLLYAALRFMVRNGYLFLRSGCIFTDWRQHVFPNKQLAYSMPVALVSLSALVGSTLNRGMLASSFTPAHYAVYSVGALEIPLDVIFQASVANVLRASLPPLVRDGNLIEIVRILRAAVRKLSIIVLPSFVFLLGHSQQFITLLFTSNYAESVTVFQIYLWLVPLHMLVLSPVPQVFGKPKLNFYIVFAMSAVVLLLGYVLLKTIGFYGPAIAVVVTQYIQVIAYFAVVLRLTKSTLRRLMPFRHIAKVILAAGVSLLASMAVDHATSSALANFVFAGVVFSLCFVLLATITKIFSDSDTKFVKRWLSAFLRINPT